MRAWLENYFIIILYNFYNRCFSVQIVKRFIKGIKFFFCKFNYTKTCFICFTISKWFCRNISIPVRKLFVNFYRSIWNWFASLHACYINYSFVYTNAGSNTKIGYLNGLKIFISCFFYFIFPAVVTVPVYVCFKLNCAVSIFQIRVQINFFKLALIFFFWINWEGFGSHFF